MSAIKTIRTVKEFARTAKNAKEATTLANFITTLRKKHGSINDLCQSKCVTALVALSGKSPSAFIADSLANIKGEDGHNIRSFLRRFGCEFTKDADGYKVKAFKVRYESADKLKDEATAADFVEDKDTTAKKSAEPAQKKVYTASEEGLKDAKAKLMKSFETSIKSLKCPQLEAYFLAKVNNMMKSMNKKGLDEATRTIK